jgi:hypothetical protein
MGTTSVTTLAGTVVVQGIAAVWEADDDSFCAHF